MPIAYEEQKKKKIIIIQPADHITIETTHTENKYQHNHKKSTQ